MPADIRSLEALAPHIREGKVFKFSMNNGKTWRYVKIVSATQEKFSDGANGYLGHEEVSPRGVHGCYALVDDDFQRGMIVRIATTAEIKGKKWSYER